MASHGTLAIEAEGLAKSFGDVSAVAGVDLAVPPGTVYGVLGPNGAGKTTTIRMLATLLRPDAGTARVFGHDVVEEADAVRSAVSLTGQLASVDEDLTGRENLVLLGRLLGFPRRAAKARADELLEAFELEEAAGRLVKNYSGGMRRRLDIAASIVVTPRLMFLDEPTTGLDLSVQKGAVYGVLGPNGAGKTTTIRILATLLRPDSGSARVLGHDVVSEADAVRGQVSLTGQLASVDEDLTGRENLILIGRLLGFPRARAKSRASELLEAFGLADAQNKQVKNYSCGMRRRIDIAASFVVTPQLMFLDEPTTGLDPRSRNQVWEIIRSLAAQGTTVLLTTQYLDEADQLAGRIAVVDHGKVIAEGTPSELKASVGSGAVHVRLMRPDCRERARDLLAQALAAPVHLEADPTALSARVSEPERVPNAMAELERADIPVAEFALGQPSLDEVFLALTGRPAVDQTEEEGEETEEEEAAA